MFIKGFSRSHHKPFFCQSRVGLGCRVFHCFSLVLYSSGCLFFLAYLFLFFLPLSFYFYLFSRSPPLPSLIHSLTHSWAPSLSLSFYFSSFCLSFIGLPRSLIPSLPFKFQALWSISIIRCSDIWLSKLSGCKSPDSSPTAIQHLPLQHATVYCNSERVTSSELEWNHSYSTVTSSAPQYIRGRYSGKHKEKLWMSKQKTYSLNKEPKSCPLTQLLSSIIHEWASSCTLKGIWCAMFGFYHTHAAPGKLLSAPHLAFTPPREREGNSYHRLTSVALCEALNLIVL